ncbi:hypothetical protein SAY86_017107 [Trapa natans]|uniref:TIR domain-containing protein n=1 Tax=Trapa natans TaxID=22666 RepID=A0AAN7M0X3_TRANT|nr:hypothetical protein SAY86_017107 [Trapa natans]
MEGFPSVQETPPDFRLEWDVFLSFHGKDTRENFTERLYNQLRQNNVRAFRDNEGMNRGDEIGPSLLAAIDDSAAAVTVISPGYASSHWCLDELVRLCDGGKRLFPVFYRVDPSDVRHQKGTFGDAFEAHRRKGRFEKERMEGWRRAMRKAGGISGWPAAKEEDDERVIKIIVRLILDLLGNSPLAVASLTVGLDFPIQHLLQKLNVNSSEVKVLGLHGMGGIGKTTLAKALYNKLVPHFKIRSFIPNIRETSKEDKGLINLQNMFLKMLSSSGGHKPVIDINEGLDAIRGRVQENPVLVVLDDVDRVDQVEAIVGRKEWFHGGSRIIITARDRTVLSSKYVTEEYEVRELGPADALKLFSYHALKRETPTDIFADLSRRMVDLTGRLPLALEVFGSFLVDKRSTKQWEEALKMLQGNATSMDRLQGVLRISFDGLEKDYKSIFLDIACLLIKMNMTYQEAIDVLHGCGYDANNAIKHLRGRSLLKITENDTLWVHDQLRDMGRNIVQSENPHNPGRRSRLWIPEEILSVLKDRKGTEDIQGIAMDYKERMPVSDPSGRTNLTGMVIFTTLAALLNEICEKYIRGRAREDEENAFDTASFQKMVNLRLLQINRARLKGQFSLLPQSIKWLQWRECPHRFLSSDVCRRELAVLDLSEGKMERLWRAGSGKVAGNLKIVILQGCSSLAAIPDLSGCQKLEKLVLEKCTSLTELHKSVGQLGSMRCLNLRGCSNLVKFPADVSGLKCLESLILSECLLLKELPKGMDRMKSLKELLVSRTAITELPESIILLEKLEKLDLTSCTLLRLLPEHIGMLHSLKELTLDNSGIVSLPVSVGSLENLEILSLRWCACLSTLPDAIGNLMCLKDLFVGGSNVQELPATIGSLRCLRELSLGNCEFSRDFPRSVEGLISLLELQLGGVSISSLPKQIGSMRMLKRLEIRDCPSLRALPESIGDLLTLTTLIISNVGITELPESFGCLEDLIILELTKCKLLHALPASFGNLKSLHHLWMNESGVVEMPESFGMLSNLVTLYMSKKPALAGDNLSVTLPSTFSNLISLTELNARACYISAGIPDDFQKLVLLETLNLGYNNFESLPSSLADLSKLKQLLLPHCHNLKSLPPLPLSLEKLDLAECRAIETIADMKNLENLEELNMVNCEKVVDVPGIEGLKSLRRLYLTGCNVCSSAVRQRISKASLRNIRVLSMPGSQIPEWMSHHEVTYRIQSNQFIKAVLIGVVVSINNDFPEELRDHIPTLADIQVTILKDDQPLFTSALPLKGIPKANEEHVHFCRFLDFHPLVSKLKDNYRICVGLRRPPMIPGTELKKAGVVLVSDIDDDYQGDERPLNEHMQTVAEKLARFINSL